MRHAGSSKQCCWLGSSRYCGGCGHAVTHAYCNTNTNRNTNRHCYGCAYGDGYSHCNVYTEANGDWAA